MPIVVCEVVSFINMVQQLLSQVALLWYVVDWLAVELWVSYLVYLVHLFQVISTNHYSVSRKNFPWLQMTNPAVTGSTDM